MKYLSKYHKNLIKKMSENKMSNKFLAPNFKVCLWHKFFVLFYRGKAEQAKPRMR